MSSSQITASLDALAQALRRGDQTAYATLISARDPGFAATAAMVFDNFRALSLATLTFGTAGPATAPSAARQTVLGSAARVQRVLVRWRLPAEAHPAEHTIAMTFVPDQGLVKLAGTTDPLDVSGPATAQPQWWGEPVTVRTAGAVTAIVATPSTAQRWVDRGQAAVDAVRRRLPGPLAARWSRRAVLEVPSSSPAFERVLGVTPGSYRTIAAVAWPEGPAASAAPVRIVVNPELADRLPDQAVAVLLAHEVTHLATSSVDSPAPLWIVEGFADYVAYDAYPTARAAAAAPLLARVRAAGTPSALPADERFSPSAADLADTYAASWLACRFVAEAYSPAQLRRLYRALDQGRSFATASRSALGVSEQTFVASWRRYLSEMAGKE